MGANAQTTVPTFTTGQVLTADQQNQSARTGVPVFATTVTRDAGFGGTGEKTLAEGQLCYVEGTGLQSYNGTSWVTWGAAPDSGLVWINTTAFSSVTSVSLNNVFTSTYNNYRVVITSGDAATAQTFTMRMRVGGSDDTTSNYARMNASNTGGGGTETVTGTTTSWFSGYVGAGSLFYTDITVFRPQETANTSIAGFTISNNSTFTSISRWTIGGWFNATTSFDGFSLLMGANTTGTVRVYGYKNS